MTREQQRKRREKIAADMRRSKDVVSVAKKYGVCPDTVYRAVRTCKPKKEKS